MIKKLRSSSVLNIFVFIIMAWSFLALPFGIYKTNRVETGIELYWNASEMFGGVIFSLIILLLSLIINKRKTEVEFCPSGVTVTNLQGVCIFIYGALLVATPSLILLLKISCIPALEGKASNGVVALGTGFLMLTIGAASALMILPRPWNTALIWGSVALLGALSISGRVPCLSLYSEWQRYAGQFAAALQQHLLLALGSVAAAAPIALLLGYGAWRKPSWQRVIMTLVNGLQVVPTLTLLSLMMLPFTALSKALPILASWGIRGIGFAPSFTVLVLYALLPIVANAYAGFSVVDQAMLVAAQGMGMTKRQVFFKVQLPLASPVLLAGIRTAVAQNMGNAVLAGLIGGGGLGTLIFLGLSQAANELVLLATIPVVMMAFGAELAFAWMEETLKKRLFIRSSDDSAKRGV